MQEFKHTDIVYEDRIIKLHHFHGERTGPNAFIVPPHAGRHGNIVQNLADALRLSGKNTYAYELKDAGMINSKTSISDLVNELNICIGIIGKTDLLGVCQGGWLSAIYTASHINKGKVNRLALFASPINTQTGEKNSIEDYCKSINLDYHRMIVNMNLGIQPGYMQWLAFAIANPVPTFMQRYFDLYNSFMDNDVESIEKWIKNNGWYDSPVNLAGTWYLDALENHFTKNKLFKGKWLVNNEMINLSHIDCDIFVYSGRNDDITHPEQARAILDIVSSENKNYTCFDDAGHTAVFVKKFCINKIMSDLY